MGAEIGVLKPQAKECWESSETGRGKEWSHPPGDFSSVTLIAFFWSRSGTEREYHSVVLNHQTCVICYTAAIGNESMGV